MRCYGNVFFFFYNMYKTPTIGHEKPLLFKKFPPEIKKQMLI